MVSLPRREANTQRPTAATASYSNENQQATSASIAPVAHQHQSVGSYSPCIIMEVINHQHVPKTGVHKVGDI